MTAGSVVRGPDGTEIVLGEIGTRIVLENSRVRVWEVALDPGQSQPWHLHHNPYVVLCLSTSPCHMDWIDGRPPRYLNETVGGAVFRPVSPVHMLTNDGDRPYRNRLIELLDLGEEATGEPQHRATGEPRFTGRASVVLAEAEVRVHHIAPYDGQPGETPTWQSGATPSLVVDLNLATPVRESVRYVEPGASVPLPENAAGHNIVELRYFGR